MKAGRNYGTRMMTAYETRNAAPRDAPAKPKPKAAKPRTKDRCQKKPS